VGVPVTDICDGHRELHVGLRELPNLLERLTERTARVVGAVVRLIARRVGDLEYLDRVKGLAAGAVHHAIGGRAVLRIDRRPNPPAAPPAPPTTKIEPLTM
jgi:hypothetical protein